MATGPLRGSVLSAFRRDVIKHEALWTYPLRGKHLVNLQRELLLVWSAELDVCVYEVKINVKAVAYCKSQGSGGLN